MSSTSSHLIMKTSILRDLFKFSFPNSVPIELLLILKGVYSPLSATYLSNPFVIFLHHTLRCWVSFLIVIFSPSRTHGDTSLWYHFISFLNSHTCIFGQQKIDVVFYYEEFSLYRSISFPLKRKEYHDNKMCCNLKKNIHSLCLKAHNTEKTFLSKMCMILHISHTASVPPVGNPNSKN